MNKHDLEETIKGKVALLLEETMEKSWGIYVPQVQSDLTDKLQHQLPIKFYIPAVSSFHEAKRKFKAEFLKNQLHLHNGNISQLAKFIGLDRRSVHRAIKGLDLHLTDLRREQPITSSPQEKLIDQTIRFTLEGYKDIIQPQKMEKMYQEVPTLSRNLAKILPHNGLTWKQAEREFEKQFLSQSLQEYRWKVAETARKLNLQPETLHRKIAKLKLSSLEKLKV
ncbi:MAG TPA: helix-turn-helix domain-containing protein [Candidatus Nanoarchaeia archaeon]|nr:helix-turn-helix domain-containing protein [Candidatus Nanoarchaeia archaeon]